MSRTGREGQRQLPPEMQELWEVTRRAHSGARGWKMTLAEPHLTAKEPWELGTLLHPILLSLPESPKVRTHSQGAEMDSGQLCPPEKTWWSQCPEECKQPPPPHSPVAAWGQPSTQSSTVQGLQTQDWVSRRLLWKSKQGGGTWFQGMEKRLLGPRREGYCMRYKGLALCCYYGHEDSLNPICLPLLGTVEQPPEVRKGVRDTSTSALSSPVLVCTQCLPFLGEVS